MILQVLYSLSVLPSIYTDFDTNLHWAFYKHDDSINNNYSLLILN